MLRPMAPSPPSGMIRRPPSGSGGRRVQLACALGHGALRSVDGQLAPSVSRCRGSPRVGAVRAQLGQLGLGRVDQRRADRAGRQAERVQGRLDQDGALGAEDAGEQRQQLAVQAQRLGDVARARTPRSSPWSAGPVKWVEVPTTPTAADRQQRQGERVVAGVVGQVGAAAVTQEVAARSPLASLTADDPLVLGEPDQRLGGDRHAGAVRDVVEHHRQPGGVGDRGEVPDQPGLRRLVVVRRDHQQAVRAGLLGRAGQLDGVLRCRWCRPRRRPGPGRRPPRPRRGAAVSFSASVVVGDSPVVPLITSASLPCSSTR